MIDSPNKRIVVLGIWISALLLQTGCDRSAASRRPDPLRAVAAYVKSGANWTSTDLKEFLYALPSDERGKLMAGLHVPHEPTAAVEEDTGAILRQLVWDGSNKLAYPFRDHNDIRWHDYVKWVARQVEVEDWKVRELTTNDLETAVCRKMFEATFPALWEKLPEGRRMELLVKIDEQSLMSNRESIAAMSGTAALAALSVTVYLTGFRFYTTMSTVMCVAAGWLGITLPFAAYMGASSATAFITGPVGWALVAVGVVCSVVLLAAPNLGRAAAAVVQIHVIKVRAMRADDQFTDA